MKTDQPDQWYVACFAGELRKKPIRRMIAGAPIVLFRDDQGHPSALLDRCPHRNAPLSEGSVKDGCLQCPYHGWKFNSQGECVEIPGWDGDLLKEESRRVETAELIEQDQLIWLRLKKPMEKPEQGPPKVLGLDEPTSHAFFFQHRSPAQMLNALENLLDATHTHFVHPGLIRKEGKRKKVTARLKRTPNEVEVRYHGEGKQSGLISKLLGSEDVVGIGRFIFPCVGQLEYRKPSGRQLALTAFFTPENGEFLRVFVGVTYRKPFGLPAWLINLILRPLFIKGMNQDARVLRQQAENINAWGGNENFQYTDLDLIRPHIVWILRRNSGAAFEKETTLWL